MTEPPHQDQLDALTRRVQTALGEPADDRAAALVEAVLAAGWRPPPRVVETVSELEELPADSFVVDKDASPWIRQLDGSWSEPLEHGIANDELVRFAPLTVLEEPAHEQERPAG